MGLLVFPLLFNGQSAKQGLLFKVPHARIYGGKKCFSHYINTNALRELILETIKTVVPTPFQMSRSLLKRSEQRLRSGSLKRKLNKARRWSAELDSLIKNLYESYFSTLFPLFLLYVIDTVH